MAVQYAAGSDVFFQDHFDYFWNQRGEWVEEPNVRRGGESGVQRVMGSDDQLLYFKRQTGHIHSSLLHPFGRPTVLRERDALIGVDEASRVEAALINLEKCRQRLSARQATAHDMKQLRRHSSFSPTDWKKLVYFYETAFGSAIKGLSQ
ncbi:MAG: lipopolysaccharide kinase InaA family protein [Pseudomonas sp.]|uniref:lipopolysaccharide kinase InaA family protein n=1 Tax=Pseudomonas sp. TaxID=306 RepID=UPI003D6F31F4